MSEQKVTPVERYIKVISVDGKLEPSGKRDWDKAIGVVQDIRGIWDSDQFKGIYFEGNLLGGIEVRVDHEPEATVPEEVYEYISEYVSASLVQK